jgi:hypothetical protein
MINLKKRHKLCPNLEKKKPLSVDKFFLFDRSYNFVLPFITHLQKNRFFID